MNLDSATLEDVRKELEVMIEIENSLSEFYQKCGELYPESKKFWSDLSKDETYHADVLTTLAKATLTRARHFKVGKAFGSGSLGSFLNQVRSNGTKLCSDTVTERDALMIAYHMEATLIEKKYTEVVITDKPEYLGALEKIDAATRIHREKLVARMKLLKNKENR